MKHLDHEKQLSYDIDHNDLEQADYEDLPQPEMWIAASNDEKEERFFGQTVNFGSQGNFFPTKLNLRIQLIWHISSRQYQKWLG